MVAVAGGGGFGVLWVAVVPEVLVLAAGPELWQPASARLAAAARTTRQGLVRSVIRRVVFVFKGCDGSNFGRVTSLSHSPLRVTECCD